jgi:hypothetical protein
MKKIETLDKIWGDGKTTAADVTKINTNELPLFQLRAQEVHWPNHIMYVSVEHFLRQFEKVVLVVW